MGRDDIATTRIFTHQNLLILPISVTMAVRPVRPHGTITGH